MDKIFAKIFIIVFLFNLCLVEKANGQFYFSSPDTALFTLDTLTVTAGRYEKSAQRLPYAFTLLEASEVQRVKKGVSLEEALRTVPGIQVSNRYNLSQGDRISIRGLGSRASFGVRGIKVMLDGIPLTMPDGQTQLNNIDVASMGRVEILRGPSSSLYGNASGGVILIESRVAPERLHLSQHVMLGSDGLQKSTSSISASHERSSFNLNYTALHSDGYRDFSQAQNHIVNAVATHQFSPVTELTAVFSYFNAPYMLNASSLTKSDALNNPRMARAFVKQQGSGKKVEQTQGGVTVKIENTFLGDVQSTLYGVSRSLDNAIPGRVIGLERQAGGWRTTLSRELSLYGIPTVLLMGSDLERQQDARTEFENNGISGDVDILHPADVLKNAQTGELLLKQDETVLNTSAFAELDLTPWPRWNLTGGIRVDRYDFSVTDYLQLNGMSRSGERRMSNISPMVGVSYQQSENLNLYSHVSTAFQTPTTTELSNRPDGIGGFNMQLQPEHIQNLEIGLKGILPDRRLHIALALYRMAITDMLIPYQINSAASEEIYFRNAGQARNYGFESAVYWYPWSWLKSSVAYTYSDFEYIDYKVETNTGSAFVQLAGNELPGVPHHQLNFGVELRTIHDISVTLNLYTSSSYWANDFNGPLDSSENPTDFRNDAFTILDLQLEVPLTVFNQNMSFFTRVDNLLDTRHNRSIVPNAFGSRFFEPAAGRSYFVGVKLDVAK